MPDTALQQFLIARGNPLEQVVYGVRQGTAMQTIVGKKLGRQHRNERQGDETRKAHGGCQRNSELAKYQTDIAGHEGHGQDYRDQDQRRRDNRETYLAASVSGREQRRLAAFDSTGNVLEHHDGVVHDEADGKDKAQHRERV